jgi:Sulfotransferase domain
MTATGDPRFNKVFGIGLSRTGTRSLARALNLLGIRTIHFPDDDVTFAQLVRGDYELAILDDYDGMTDTPAAAFFPQLDTAFPGSLFVLTTRPRGAWLDSCERLWAYTAEAQEEPCTRFVNAALYGTWYFQRERFAYVFDRHVAHAHGYFAGRPRDLLVMDFAGGDGWGELCPFLGVSAPAGDVPFPHENSWEKHGPAGAFG